MGFCDELAELYARDLAALRKQVELFADDEMLWKALPGVVNPAGNIVLHLVGNLREYVGRLLGGVAYVRDRPLEFSARGLSKAELLAKLAEVEEMVPGIVRGLSEETLEEMGERPGQDEPRSTRYFLLHLYAHLSWHLGQIDYLRRILGEEHSKA